MKWRLCTAVLWVIAVCAASVRADAPATQPARAMVYLTAPSQLPGENVPPLLLRELNRQALLIAARDGLGLHTRDGVMRECDASVVIHPPADALGKPVLRMDARVSSPPNDIVTTIYREGAQPETIVENSTPFPHGNHAFTDLPAALARIEPLSRTTYIDLLKKVGFEGVPNATCDAAAPAGVDDLLYQTTLLSQFSAIQQTHAVITASGESPARLGALVRGYANLGQLTSFQWSSINKVLSARSLLYAQRMVNADSKSPNAYWHRAYAFAMVGLHAAALKDLKTASQLQKGLQAGGKQAIAPPPWVALIEPFCGYDVEKLTGLNDPDHRLAPLIALTSFMNVEYCGSVSRMMEMGKISLQANPNCFRIMDGMMAFAGVSYGHMLTEMAPAAMLQSLPADIKHLSQVPQSTQNALKAAYGRNDHIRNLAEVTNSLINATEVSEPSFMLAGRLIEETNFVHAERRAHFMADMWGIDTRDYVQSIFPLIKDHPYHVFVEVFKYQGRLAMDVVRSAQYVDPQDQMIDGLVITYGLGNPLGQMTGKIAWNRATSNMDSTAWNYEIEINPYSPSPNFHYLRLAQGLLEVSPACTVGLAISIHEDWAHCKQFAQTWATQYQKDPAVLAALAKKYIEINEPDKAEPLLQKYIQIAPDQWAYETLAGLYLARADEDKWLATLQQFLHQEDYGLSQASVQVEIAKHFMNTGKFDKAVPFADAAAESYAGWGLQCAANAHEGIGDYTGAANFMQAQGERYGGNSWYLWCRRTGHGDLKAAQVVVDQWIKSQEGSNRPSEVGACGAVCLLEGNPAAARPYFTKAMHLENNPLDAIELALTCQQLKDKPGHDAALHYAIEHGPAFKNANGQPDNAMLKLAQMLLDAGDQPIDGDAVEQLAANAEPVSQLHIYYIAGRQAQLVGDNESAENYYTLCQALPFKTFTSEVMACAALREMLGNAPQPGH